MSEEDKTTYDLKDICDPWSPEEAARVEALRGRAMVELLDENNRLRAALEAAQKERDEARTEAKALIESGLCHENKENEG